MKPFILIFLLIVPVNIENRSDPNLEKVFWHIKQLEFEEAKKNILLISDSTLKAELLNLNDLLYYAGQRDSSYYGIRDLESTTGSSVLSFLQMLNNGYFELFYHKTKSEAFRHFYLALETSRELKDKSLQKAALLGILQYYHFEIAQNSQDYEKYLQDYEKLDPDDLDELWITLYRLIFYSKSLGELDVSYFDVLNQLNAIESKIGLNNKILPIIYFEKGLGKEIEGNFAEAREYYIKAFDYSKDFPFLRNIRFASLIKMSVISQNEGDIEDALLFVNKAKEYIDLADTLRSNYYINLYSSLYYNDLKKYDTAYHLLNKAYKADFYLDFRRNSLEINRLNVVLQTQQKELENSRLRQNKIWLIVASSILGLLLMLSYLALQNIRSKKHIVEKEKEIQTQKVEKLIREQELSGIDAMIEGQEKERQRLANELHDHLGSLLATVKYHIQNVRINRQQGGVGEEVLLDKADDLLEQAYQKVRGIAHERNAGVPAKEGLLPAVKNFASKVSHNNRLKIDVIDHGMDKRLENSLELTLFRIIQELITNIIKHSGGKEASIQLTHHETSINVLVEDDGAGFEASTVPAGMGLYAIRKRIDSLAGKLTIDSAPGKGTTVIIDIPL